MADVCVQGVFTCCVSVCECVHGVHIYVCMWCVKSVWCAYGTMHVVCLCAGHAWCAYGVCVWCACVVCARCVCVCVHVV